MAVYTEKEEKLTFQLNGSTDPVKIELVSVSATEVSVTYGFPPQTVNSQNPVKEVGSPTSLKNKAISFNGSANNPMGNFNKVKHIISQGDKQLIYTISDDYTGVPDYLDTDETVAYCFKVKFI